MSDIQRKSHHVFRQQTAEVVVSDSMNKIDFFEDITFNHEHIDWQDPKVNAKSVSRVLMGKQTHWKEPEFAGMSEMEIEREILFEAGSENWGYDSPYGKPYYQHLHTLIHILDPSTDIAPTLADAVMFFCLSRSMGKKILNLIGCQNASKSATSVRLAFACLYVDPEYTVFYIANPFDNAADSTIWGEVEDVWQSMCEHHPHESGNPSFFPKAQVHASNPKRIEVIKDIPKAARIELRNVKHVGKYKGTKARKDSNNQVRGILGMLIDEVNEIDNMSFLQMLTNLTSQDNFFALTSQNFKDTEDMGGMLTHPTDIYGGPTTFEDLDVETDIYWHSRVASITLRFDGLKQANILAGRTIYPYLFKQANLDLLKENYGDRSPEWYSQCRSFPIRGIDANSVLSQAKISGSRYTDRVFNIMRINGTVSFCDPSFGGKDRAVWGFAQFVTAVVTDGAGQKEQIEMLLFTDHMKPLTLSKDQKYGNHWYGRLEAIGVDVKQFPEGSEVSYEDQIAIQCSELNRAHGIPEECFGYDFSMRADIVSSVNKIIGFKAFAYNYNRKPDNFFLQNIKRSTEDCCYNIIDELAFLSSDLFLSRQIRGGQFIETAVLQLSRTRYEEKNEKYKVERKADYKSRWQNVSPDHRDVLMGIVGMAHKRGFRAHNISKKGGGSASHARTLLKGSRRHQAKTRKRI